ncbi:NAD(P)-binding domain-containing protein [Ruegeria conchae]|uniref:pyrroline-5-carboxylate reductase family protein n=1 Tax=Ruegeria conchae TaxID=981384 RepID=UPI0021A88127|nr:pyrroline-5-carboxylate reductase dimerization domain-containing protein [Ruegeria conchae]UWR01917.1 NAD(P)-binding domain-containing protein [Ruegeria conchae]
METAGNTIGIIGGSGMLGSAISGALLGSGAFEQSNFWVSNRSGAASGVEQRSSINFTKDNQKLVDACDVIILCVPPARFPDIAIRAPNKLVISVMAGVTIDEMKSKTAAVRVVRAMSSPAASLSMAYSPWIASAETTPADKNIVSKIFGACGTTDEVFDEQQLDHFTAMTGPVPGFVAYFAKCMVDHATSQGIAPDVADRAIRQLFLAGGTMLAADSASPADQVRWMIEYAGTTAAGLIAMERSTLSKAISDGLLAAADKARSI